MSNFIYLFRRGAKGDRVDVDLPNRNAAWGEAVRACGEALKDLGDTLDPDEAIVMSVHDQHGLPLWEIECRSKTCKSLD